MQTKVGLLFKSFQDNKIYQLNVPNKNVREFFNEVCRQEEFQNALNDYINEIVFNDYISETPEYKDVLYEIYNDTASNEVYLISNLYNYKYRVKILKDENNDLDFQVQFNTEKYNRRTRKVINHCMFQTSNEYMLYHYVTLKVPQSFIDYLYTLQDEKLIQIYNPDYERNLINQYADMKKPRNEQTIVKNSLQFQIFSIIYAMNTQNIQEDDNNNDTDAEADIYSIIYDKLKNKIPENDELYEHCNSIDVRSSQFQFFIEKANQIDMLEEKGIYIQPCYYYVYDIVQQQNPILNNNAQNIDQLNHIRKVNFACRPVRTETNADLQ